MDNAKFDKFRKVSTENENLLHQILFEISGQQMLAQGEDEESDDSDTVSGSCVFTKNLKI